jgi:peptide-methionine (S)-S-oxide reductase
MNKKSDSQTAVFGSGCFWCAEAIFRQLRGVESVTPGYAGGYTSDPTYQQVCTGTTGHAEVVRIQFDPAIITYADLLEIFWQIHDPTTPNRQGNDVGSQYRSIVLPMNQEQEQIAQKMVQKLKEQKVFPSPIVTEIVPLKEFYPAEKYHENYYFLNEEQPYCQLVISPKLQKFRKKYQDRLSS